MVPFIENSGLAELIFLFLASASLLLLLSYYFFVFSKLAFAKPRKEVAPAKTEPVSVIICARNEAKFLELHLPEILEQDYPDFQVVVVNDCSWDESEALLDKMETKYPRLKVVTIQEMEKYSHGKKFALTLGIKASAHELLLLTDADCRPAGKDWLKTMARNFSQEKKIILGYGAYEKKPGMLNLLIRYDTFHNALQYFSFAMLGMPYCGVGRNMAYRKSLFFENKGFARHQHILSGDDDLFVNENATRSNTAVEISPASFTISIPKDSYSAWVTQKERHLSTSKYYKSSHKFALGFYWLLQMLFYGSLVTLLFLGTDWRILSGLFVLKVLSQFLIFGKAMQRLGELDLVWLMPFWDLIMILIYPTFAVQGFFGNQKKWK